MQITSVPVVEAARLHFDTDIPARIEVGYGTVLAVRGWVGNRQGEGRVLAIDCHAGGARGDADLNEIRTDVTRAPGESVSGFFMLLPLPADLAGTSARVVATARFRAGPALTLVDRDVEFVARLREPEHHCARIAICLTTYNPDPLLFERQIQSLIEQTERDWVCLVNDDTSEPAAWAHIQRICARDDRFVLRRNPQRLGFYLNFEACLRRVPTNVAYVALCDQDDAWHPDKLASCAARLVGNVQLVYSDMRLVDRGGGLIAGTYWTQRHNNWRSFDTLLLANTVTGAASMIRRELVDAVLPFPPNLGDGYHDHWLACVAMCAGPIDYIDRALYDYTQHGDNVIGHFDFPPLSPQDAMRAHASMLAEVLRHRGRLRAEMAANLALYYREYRKLALYRTILLLRFPALPHDRRRALDLFVGRWRDVLRLVLPTHARILRRGDSTNFIEFRLGLGLATHKLICLIQR